MKPIIALAACAAALFGSVIDGQARPGGRIGRPETVGTTIGVGVTVTSQNLPNGGSLVNNGRINGGSQTAVTSTGPNPVTITNNGVITSSTGGISTTGNSSSTIVNNGTIAIVNTVTSTTGHATATGGTGISQTAGP